MNLNSNTWNAFAMQSLRLAAVFVTRLEPFWLGTARHAGSMAAAAWLLLLLISRQLNGMAARRAARLLERVEI